MSEPAGAICWVNMLTPRPAEARAFYARLLGWEYLEMPGMGHRARVGGRDFGAIFDLGGPQTPPGTPPHIGVMVRVESADELARRVAELGGSARAPLDVGEAGRMAACTDPAGARFDGWQVKSAMGPAVDRAVRGAPCWFELDTSDLAGASAFYAALFGWQPESRALPLGEYVTFRLGGTPLAGALAAGRTPGLPKAEPHWATYFRVDDADRAARETAAEGGTVRVPPHDMPGVGRACGLVSPQGVAFSVLAAAR